MKIDNLAGKKFGKLTAIKLTAPTITPKGTKMTTWLCKCECGRERTVRSTYLKRGQVTYCGECTPPVTVKAKNRKCRYCEFSRWNGSTDDWHCTKGKDVSTIEDLCDKFWCAPLDKLTGVKTKEGVCYICGKPVYAHSNNVPIYCYEHRAYAERDQKILDEAPKELLFSLIAGIFLRAREDYVTNANNQRSDAEVFFKGAWAQNLSVDGFDVGKLFEILDEEMANEAGRTEEEDR